MGERNNELLDFLLESLKHHESEIVRLKRAIVKFASHGSKNNSEQMQIIDLEQLPYGFYSEAIKDTFEGDKTLQLSAQQICASVMKKYLIPDSHRITVRQRIYTQIRRASANESLQIVSQEEGMAPKYILGKKWME